MKSSGFGLVLTLRDFLVRHVVSGRESVFGHGHVSVEGQGQNPSGRLDLRRHPGPTVSTNQRAHCQPNNHSLLIHQPVDVLSVNAAFVDC